MRGSCPQRIKLLSGIGPFFDQLLLQLPQPSLVLGARRRVVNRLHVGING